MAYDGSGDNDTPAKWHEFKDSVAFQCRLLGVQVDHDPLPKPAKPISRRVVPDCTFEAQADLQESEWMALRRMANQIKKAATTGQKADAAAASKARQAKSRALKVPECTKCAEPTACTCGSRAGMAAVSRVKHEVRALSRERQQHHRAQENQERKEQRQQRQQAAAEKREAAAARAAAKKRSSGRGGGAGARAKGRARRYYQDSNSDADATDAAGDGDGSSPPRRRRRRAAGAVGGAMFPPLQRIPDVHKGVWTVIRRM
jgi:colicin import membrane protein